MIESKPTLSLDEAKILLIKFLGKHPTTWYNTKKMVCWGTQQIGFERLQSLSYMKIDGILKELAESKKIMQKQSSKGSWFLYKANAPA